MFQPAGIGVQAFCPAGECWKVSVSTPESESAVVAVRSTVPVSGVPGSSSEAVGATLSTVTVTTSEVFTLPTRSVTVTRRSYWPPGSRVVSQLVSVAVQVPLPAGEYS